MKGTLRIEQFFVVTVLLLSMGAFMNLTVTGPWNRPNTGMLGMQILWSVIYLISLILYLKACDNPFRTLFKIFPVLAVLIFVSASTLWSQSPELTARRSVALTLTSIFGLYFSCRFSFKEQLRLICIAFAIAMAGSFFFELLDLNPDQGVPGWYGIFYQKNNLGKNMALAALIFLFWYRLHPSHKTLARLGMVVSIVLMLLARSTTSLVILMVVLLLLPYFQWALRLSAFWAVSGVVFLGGVSAVFIFFASTHLEAITGTLGKDAMLTGRVPLWILATAMALRRPWLGYGYDAFWSPDQVYTLRIWHILGWMPPHAHNGFLELWLEIGILGAGVFLLGYVYYIARALMFWRQSQNKAIAGWPLIFLLFVLFGNLTESSFLANNNIFFILYVSTAILLQQADIRLLDNGSIYRQRYA